MFAAIFNLDRKPVDAERFQAGDSGRWQALGSSGHVALLCSTPGSAPADRELAGIATLDGRYWMTGRIRLDARDDLRSRLAAPSGTSDALLCLRAYAAWGEPFLDHLRGDFSFALWDEAAGRLIAARDQLGVRTLFHARAGRTCFVGDSLDWLAARPEISRGLDECWIADFLTQGFCAEFERSVYGAVRRLAPGHALILGESGESLRRYWRLEVAEPLHHRDRRLYPEQFRDLLSRAIADRLPDGRVGVSMSGGLDSTTLAACAVAAAGGPARVVAECDYFETLMPDDEPHFAALAARHLGIDLRLRASDALGYDPLWRTRDLRDPEPSVLAIGAEHDRQIALEMAEQAGVWLYGEGPDNALKLDRDAYLSWLLKRGELGRLAQALWRYARVKGAAGWKATLRRHLARAAVPEAGLGVPPWLDRRFVDRGGLVERLRAVGRQDEVRHPWHPAAVASFGQPLWQAFLEDLQRDERVAPLVWRHPYLDLRVLEFMLSVPPLPWAWEKQLLREAMRGRLPAEVLARPKTPLAGSPLAEPIRRHGLPELSGGSPLADFVDVGQLAAAGVAGPHLSQVIAVHALDHWLAKR